MAGVADAVQARGIAVVRSDGARGAPRGQQGVREGRHAPSRASRPRESRAFAARELDQALDLPRHAGFPVVVKADGLAAGKGVTVATTLEEAEAAVRRVLRRRASARRARRVLIEEFLEGQECSLLAFTDGDDGARRWSPAQDHKRAFDGDAGPNTGGMGVYSPVPAVDDGPPGDDGGLAASARSPACTPRASSYRGVLYGGFILTADGPARCSSTTPASATPRRRSCCRGCETDLVDVMLAVRDGTLADVDAAVERPTRRSRVVLASGGYPGDYEKGKVITGIEEAEARPGRHRLPRRHRAARRRRARHRRRPRAQRDRARAHAAPRRANARTRRSPRSRSRACSTAPTSRHVVALGAS